VKNNEIYINILSVGVKNLFPEKDQIFVKRRRFFFQKGLKYSEDLHNPAA
jgi:hypothetical protein